MKALNCRAEQERFIGACVKIKRASLKNRSELKIVLLELYETIFGIYDHVRASSVPGESPLSLNFVKPNQDLSFLLKEAVEKYVTHNVRSVFGCSLTEYLAIPTALRDTMIEVAAERAKSSKSELDEIKKAFDNS